MLSSQRLLRGTPFWKMLRAQPLPPITKKARPLPRYPLIEEERNPRSPVKSNYPVRLGEVLNNRYQVAVKLGWGARSTVWLARDLERWRWQAPRFVALKIGVSNFQGLDEETFTREITALERIAAMKPHIGRQCVREMLDHFSISGPAGTHPCMTFEPLRSPMSDLGQYFGQKTMPTALLSILAEPVLHGLDFLHRECHIIHCDLKSSNIIMRFPRGRQLRDLLWHEQYERSTPLQQRHLPDLTIYLSHNVFRPLKMREGGPGAPVITDFDRSVRGDTGETYTYLIHQVCNRAPEVMLGLPWSYSADIWNLGMTFCELLAGRLPFDGEVDDPNPPSQPISREPPFSDERYMASMISYLGHPPQNLVQARKQHADMFDESGTFVHLSLVEPDCTFEKFFANEENDEERRLAIAFLQRMLKWKPEERATAQELLEDPFLCCNREKT